MKLNKNVNSYDYLRVIATYAVVLLHTAAPLLFLYNELSLNQWMIANTFDSMVRWCVPIFFMISGAFLLDPSKSASLFIFFKKRMNKVLIPFIAWSIIYYSYSVLTNKTENSLEIFIKGIFNNDISNHLWYLYILIGLYLITPILSVLIQHLNKPLFLYMLVLWFIGNSVFNLANHLFEINIYFDFVIDDYLGYYLLGYFLKTQYINKKVTSTIYLLAFISLLVTIFGTYFDTFNNSGNFVGFYYNYLSPNTIIISIAIFLLFKLELKPNSLINFINKRSFGIYLIHMLVIKILSDIFNIDGSSFHPLISIPVVSIITFSISCFIIFILQKVPFLKKIVP
jgi:surface polysaccharide O-acyltransferase-like enzyme